MQRLQILQWWARGGLNDLVFAREDVQAEGEKLYDDK